MQTKKTLTRYMAQWPKWGAQHRGQILSANFQRVLLSSPNSNRPKTGGIGKLMFLSFQGYVVLQKRSPFVAWATILVQTAPGGQGGLL